MRCLVRLSQIGGVAERMIFSFLSEVLSLQMVSVFEAKLFFAPYIPANVMTNANAIIQPVLVLISDVFDVYDEDILEMLHQRLINIKNS